MANTGKTPAQMIMVGILQIRDSYNKAFAGREYYNASRFLHNLYSTLPLEAQQEYKLAPPPAADDAPTIDDNLSVECRKYCDAHASKIHFLVPKYVYGYFEKGRRMKRGY